MTIALHAAAARLENVCNQFDAKLFLKQLLAVPDSNWTWMCSFFHNLTLIIFVVVDKVLVMLICNNVASFKVKLSAIQKEWRSNRMNNDSHCNTLHNVFQWTIKFGTLLSLYVRKT